MSKGLVFLLHPCEKRRVDLVPGGNVLVHAHGYAGALAAREAGPRLWDTLLEAVLVDFLWERLLELILGAVWLGGGTYLEQFPRVGDVALALDLTDDRLLERCGVHVFGVRAI